MDSQKINIIKWVEHYIYFRPEIKIYSSRNSIFVLTNVNILIFWITHQYITSWSLL
jgi:hypothetical protein